MAAVPQDSYDWRWYYARLPQEAAQAQNVGWMAEADIGDYCGHGPRSVLLFVKPDRSTPAKAAECMSQCPASVWAIRNQNDRSVARHGLAPDLTGLQVDNGTTRYDRRELANIW